MIHRLIRALWGDLTKDELKKFGLLALIFFTIIGSYWLMRVMKDAQFALLVGYSYEPFAKIISVFFVIIALLSYNKLIDLVKKTELFYFICIFFGVSFIVLGYLIGIFSAQIAPDITPGFISYFRLAPRNLVGWATYFFLESFGSLLPALFWSFTASTVTTESAKKGYGLIFMFGQLGAIAGSSTTYFFSGGGLGRIFMLGGFVVMAIPLLVSVYAKEMGSFDKKDEDVSVPNPDQEIPTGILEGFKLLIRLPYVAGLFVVTTFYEVIGTIVEYQMGYCAAQVFPPLLDAGVGIAEFKSLNGIAIGSLSLAFALFGTSFFIRRFGLKFCLITFPVIIVGVVIATFSFYISGVSMVFLMWVFFVSEVIFRGLSYTLNNPVKEILYIPTSNGIKFKAKSWIDMFGNRAVKGIGSMVTATLRASFSRLFIFGSLISLGVASAWMIVAIFLGNTFDDLQENKEVIR